MSPPLHLIYPESGLLLSKKHYADWREIQADFPDYKTSLGPWTLAEMTDFLHTEYGTRNPFTEARLQAFLPSAEQTLFA